MFAIILDKNGYIHSYSDKFRKPQSILVNSIPYEDDPEKLKCYQYIDDHFVFDAEKWAAIEDSRKEAERIKEEAFKTSEEEMQILEAQQQISNLKEMLTASDYQIIKCYEYALNNLELPYDVVELHAERQALRDQINELEANINTVEKGLQ